MKFFKILLKIFLLVSIIWKIQSKDVFVGPIKELLKKLEYPVQITAMICWNLNDRLIFTKELMSESTYQFAITKPLIRNFPNSLNEHQQLIIVDLDCNETRKFLNDIRSKLTHKYKWIALSDRLTLDNDEFKNIFVDLPILTSSEFYCILRFNLRGEFVIVQVYKPSMQQGLIVEHFGIFKNDELIVQQKIKESAIRRRNLQGTKLSASLVITNNDTFKHLSDYSLEYKFVDSWGYQDDKTNQWNGMIGDLIDNRSDIGASALFFTIDRIKYIEYIAMVTPTRSKFVFRSPKLSYTDNVYLLPFDELVWYSLFGLMLVTSFVLLSVTWLESKIDFSIDETTTNASTLRPSVLDVFILVFGASCQQGSSVAPISFTARFIMMLIFTTLMFLYTSYSANIVALLQSPSHKIQTLEDLLHSRLKLGADDTVFNHYYFKHATEHTRKAIYEEKIRNRDGSENFLTLAEGVEKIREGLFAFHFETGVGYKILEEIFHEYEKCGLQEIQYLQVVDPWYSIQKNSSYKELFKVGLMRIHEHGLQERENFALYTRKPKCISGGGKFITASLVDTKPTMLILLWGYVAAFIILLMERAIYKMKLKIQTSLH